MVGDEYSVLGVAYKLPVEKLLVSVMPLESDEVRAGEEMGVGLAVVLLMTVLSDPTTIFMEPTTVLVLPVILLVLPDTLLVSPLRVLLFPFTALHVPLMQLSVPLPLLLLPVMVLFAPAIVFEVDEVGGDMVDDNEVVVG